MKKISDNEIKKIAQLSRLSLTPEEITKFSADFLVIIKLIDEAKNSNTNGMEPMSHPLDLIQRLRKDEVTEHSSSDALQKIAPKIESELYLVPKIIE